MHITPAVLMETIDRLNNDQSVDGIILQLPLPLHLIEQTKVFVDAIRADKDVDAHATMNNHQFRQSSSSSLPLLTIPVVAAVREILLEIGEPLQGKDVVVIGRSRYVGTPLALMLSQSTHQNDNPLIGDATVTICHRETHATNLAWHCKHADVVISAVGRASMFARSCKLYLLFVCRTYHPSYDQRRSYCDRCRHFEELDR